MIECLLSMCEALSLNPSNVHTKFFPWSLGCGSVVWYLSSLHNVLDSILITTKGGKNGRQDSYPGPSDSPSMSLMKQMNMEKSLEVFSNSSKGIL